jgi:hypothetical protein
MARTKVKIRAGNYAAEGDTTGMDEEMKATLTGTPMTKTESAYVKGTGRPSAIKAVQRARKANKQPLLRP